MQSRTTYNISAWAAPPVACCACNCIMHNTVSPPEDDIILYDKRATAWHIVPRGSAFFTFGLVALAPLVTLNYL